jgi:FlaA1/EpsC-like NDP-sugar epimerase
MRTSRIQSEVAATGKTWLVTGSAGFIGSYLTVTADWCLEHGALRAAG